MAGKEPRFRRPHKVPFQSQFALQILKIRDARYGKRNFKSQKLLGLYQK